MELVMPNSGMEFMFDLYYDRITDEQLKRLLWVITLGENDPKSVFCHKLGHGKSLGLGSVKIIVMSQRERIVEPDMGYRLCDSQVSSVLQHGSCDENTVKALKKVLDMEEPFRSAKNRELSIDYPNIVDKKEKAYSAEQQSKNNDVARHQWYTRNKEKKQGEIQVLPEILADSQKLFAMSYLGNVMGEETPEET